MHTAIHPNVVPFEHLLAYLTSFKPTFTARGRETRFTYKLKTPKFNGKRNEDLRFVSVLTGPDNTSSYTMFGIMFKQYGQWQFRMYQKSRIGVDAQSVKAFKYILTHVLNGVPMPQVEIWHDGRCGRCSHPLTDPESIRKGIGPVCEGL